MFRVGGVGVLWCQTGQLVGTKNGEELVGSEFGLSFTGKVSKCEACLKVQDLLVDALYVFIFYLLNVISSDCGRDKITKLGPGER